MKIRILDLDNCIANDAWRIPFIDWNEKEPFKRYHKYHSLAAFDMVGNHDLFSKHFGAIVILTARPEIYRHTTEHWLRVHGIGALHVVMRQPSHEGLPSFILKERQLLDFLQINQLPLSAIECCYDDRSDIVNMYRELGFNAEVRRIHDICAYTQPALELAR